MNSKKSWLWSLIVLKSTLFNLKIPSPLTLLLLRDYSDMNSSNIYTVGLALCTMGDIASPEMSRDLAPEIDKLLGSSNSYIKKKVPAWFIGNHPSNYPGLWQAALCAIKSVRKVPDLIEQFLPRAKAMLSEKNHAVLLTGVSLINEMIIINPAVTDEFRPVSFVQTPAEAVTLE